MFSRTVLLRRFRGRLTALKERGEHEMSRFWYGLMIGGAAGMAVMALVTRRRQPETVRQRVVRTAGEKAEEARRSLSSAVDSSRRRAARLMPNRK
jgi:gas vesicle protein